MSSLKYRAVFFVMTVVLVPGIARAVSDEKETVPNVQFETAHGMHARTPALKKTEAPVLGRSKPVLPLNVEPASRPAVMPRNEKIRILPLSSLKVPSAAVLARPVQPSVFKVHPIVQPAVPPAAKAAAKSAADSKA